MKQYQLLSNKSVPQVSLLDQMLYRFIVTLSIFGIAFCAVCYIFGL